MQAFLSLGHLHIPVNALFAAAGLMLAMALGLRTAPMAQTDPDALWNAEAITVLSLFGLSRGLFVLENLRMFLRYPVLILELPSVTLSGVVLTAIVVVVYLRRRRLPLLNLLDAVSPGAALLWAFLNAGRAADGTRDGMPVSLPWAVLSSFGRVHPVEIYTAVSGLLLCGILFWILQRSRIAGETTAWGMILSALAQFTICFFRLPQVLYGNSLVDGSQWRAVELMVAGGLLLAWRVGVGVQSQSSPKDVGDAI